MTVIKSNVRHVEVMQVIRITSVVGKGVDGDPFREFVEYRDMNGNLLNTGDLMSYV